MMRRPPNLIHFFRYPVIAGTALLTIVVTLAWWAKIDVSLLIGSSMIRRGELWRLVTSIFLHRDILHLVFNIYWLWVFGTLVEEVFGHLKTAVLVLLFSLGPNALEYAFANGGVGLSGAGYGLFGLLWVLSKRDERFRDAIDHRTIQIFVGWFFVCIVLTAINILPVGNIAHGAGAVLGMLTGFVITLPERLAPVSSGVVALLFGLWAATLGRPTVNLSRYGSYDECNQGYTALVANRNEEAVHWFREAVAYHHSVPVCWLNLGISYQRLNNSVAALAAFRKAAEMGDADGQFYVGTMYESGSGGLAKDSQQALYWYRKAADQGSAAGMNNAAWAFATSSDPAIRNPALALEYARLAVAAGQNHPDPNHLDTLAEAYYVNGQYDDAVKTEQRAIALASADANGQFQKSLEKYLRAAQSTRHHKAK
jgi:membrane associated rhomboid family serine protease